MFLNICGNPDVGFVMSWLNIEYFFFSEKQFELFRERRRKMHERSVSPVNVEEARSELSPLQCAYSPDELCREPDYKLKCQFFSHLLRLEPVPATTRLGIYYF